MKTAIEVLKEHIPNYKTVESWNVTLFKDGKDHFSQQILKAMEDYAIQFADNAIHRFGNYLMKEAEIEPEKDYNIFGDDDRPMIYRTTNT